MHAGIKAIPCLWKGSLAGEHETKLRQYIQNWTKNRIRLTASKCFCNLSLYNITQWIHAMMLVTTDMIMTHAALFHINVLSCDYSTSIVIGHNDSKLLCITRSSYIIWTCYRGLVFHQWQCVTTTPQSNAVIDFAILHHEMIYIMSRQPNSVIYVGASPEWDKLVLLESYQ